MVLGELGFDAEKRRLEKRAEAKKAGEAEKHEGNSVDEGSDWE